MNFLLFIFIYNDDDSSDGEGEVAGKAPKEAIFSQPESLNVNETTSLNPAEKPPTYTSGKTV